MHDLKGCQMRARSSAFVLIMGWLALPAVAADAHFDADSYLAHIQYLASDALEGRAPGTPGIELAAEYIGNHFEGLGLQPAGVDGSFFQPFEVHLKARRTGKSVLSIGGIYDDVAADQDFAPFNFSSGDAFSGPAVFAGYGIVNSEKNFDDFAHLDVQGAVVIILRREPPSWSSDAGDVTQHAEFRNKVYNVKDRGGAAVIIVNQRPEEGGEDKLVAWGQGGGMGRANFGLPALQITRALADKVLALGDLDSLDVLQEKLDNGEYASKPIEGVNIKGVAGVTQETATTRNVLGMLKGKGPHADEVVVIGAHYDHLGIAVPRARFGDSAEAEDAPREPEIHNGADDNASGTAGVIELARQFAANGALDRSILFMTFSAEESGLLGSKYFVEHPTVPLGKIVTMINMDMIGRLPEGSHRLQVFGTKAATEFSDMLERLTKAHGFELFGSASAVGPSDHTSFYNKKIPSLHFFTGLHEDYHRPSDDVDKINAAGAVAVLGVIYDTALEIDKADARPTYHEVKAPAGPGRSGYRVVMGIMPSYVDSDKGMLVDGVAGGGPADKAGMKAGDLIVQIGDSKVTNIYDYMAALRNNNPGDAVKVHVKRGDEDVTLEVKLGGR